MTKKFTCGDVVFNSLEFIGILFFYNYRRSSNRITIFISYCAFDTNMRLKLFSKAIKKKLKLKKKVKTNNIQLRKKKLTKAYQPYEFIESVYVIFPVLFKLFARRKLMTSEFNSDFKTI
jgi:hypothetical protein